MLIPLALVMGQQKKRPRSDRLPPRPRIRQLRSQPLQPHPRAPVPALAPPPSSNAEQAKIPAGAKEVEPFLYTYTDAEGKKWFYRRDSLRRRQVGRQAR